MSSEDTLDSSEEEFIECYKEHLRRKKGKEMYEQGEIGGGGGRNEAQPQNSQARTSDIVPLVEAAVREALQFQADILKVEFDAKLAEISRELQGLRVSNAPQVEVYEAVEVVQLIPCDEPLDIVKSVPEFDGKQDQYVSWRQAATAAYKLFEPYVGSSRHYQAVAILRNKIRGTASATLASFNTVLNFKAILARLDFTYADKTPIRVVQQEMDTLRQGDMTLLQYYDEVEKRLTLITNKTIMTQERGAAAVYNEKFRNDALHTFVSGLRKNLKTAVFPAQPRDLPTALALAQEAEASNDRYAFATSFARGAEGSSQKTRGSGPSSSQARRLYDDHQGGRNPHFTRGQKSGPGQAHNNGTLAAPGSILGRTETQVRNLWT